MSSSVKRNFSWNFTLTFSGYIFPFLTYPYASRVMGVENIGICNLVFNVTNLKFIDYKGIYKLLYNYEIVKKNKGRVLLCGNNLKICNKLKKCRLLHYIKEIKDELYAIKIFKIG